jgi:small subunit ribosomal protein S21
MLIVKLKEGENIERALKRFKRKFNQTQMTKQLREREQFEKPSVKRRKELLKAKYIQKLRDEEAKDQ